MARRFDSAGRLRLDQLPGVVVGATVPGSGGGSSLVNTPRKVATNAPLPAGDFDGQTGELRVGTFPDMAVMRFTWFATPGKWVSDEISLIDQMDQGYLSFSNTASFQYLSSTTNASGTATQTGWTSREAAYAGQLYAQGCRLQALIAGIIAGNSVDTGSVRAYFFQHDDNDTVNTISGGAPNGAVGNTNSITGGVEAVNPGVTAGRMRSSGWHDVVLSSMTKKMLWGQLFAQKNGVGNAGVCQALDVSVIVRWVI